MLEEKIDMADDYLYEKLCERYGRAFVEDLLHLPRLPGPPPERYYSQDHSESMTRVDESNSHIPTLSVAF